MFASPEEVKVGDQDITKEVWGSLASLWETELAIAEEEQIKLMQAEARVSGKERKHLEFGYLRMKICPEVYHFWSQKLGSEIWQDEGFKKWLEKRFGDLIKIKSVSARVGI